MQVKDAMIVAGGQGMRLRPLTLSTPKPLLPFCGAPLLAGMIGRLSVAGVKRVFLVVGADTKPFEALRADAADAGVILELVDEPEPLDTAGGVRSVVDEIDDTFLVLNGDIVTDVDLHAAITHHREHHAAATLVLTRVADPSSYGLCVLDGTRIVDFVEKPTADALPGQDCINAGTYVLEPEALQGFPPGRLSFERTVFPGLVEDGARVEGLVSDAYWADLGTPERFLAGHKAALDGALRWPTVPDDVRKTGISTTATVAADAIVVPPVLIASGVSIGARAVVGPHVVVGERGRIGPGVTVRDSVLFADSVLDTDAAELILGFRARLSAGVRLEGGAVVGDDVSVDDPQVPAGARVGGAS
ncbi:MAG: NDP-sugar synthase [Nitriliruptoraceae bacterium]